VASLPSPSGEFTPAPLCPSCLPVSNHGFNFQHPPAVSQPTMSQVVTRASALHAELQACKCFMMLLHCGDNLQLVFQRVVSEGEVLLPPVAPASLRRHQHEIRGTPAPAYYLAETTACRCQQLPGTAGDGVQGVSDVRLW
jgi:hypothetical protein